MSIDVFLNQTLQELKDHLIWLKRDAKRYEAQKYYLPTRIIKNYNIIINGKHFYDQPIDFDKKQYGKIKKLIK